MLGLAGCANQRVEIDFNFPEATADAFIYENVNDEINIIGLTERGKTLESINIPASIDGKPVVRLKNTKAVKNPGSLWEYESLDESSFICDVKNIVIPNTIKYIDKYFFSQTKANALLYNGQSILSAYRAFRESSISEIVIGEGVTFIPEATFEAADLEYVHFPTTLKYIGNHAFYSCIYLKAVEFNESMTKIGAHAFYGCSDLKNVCFNEGLEEIGAWSFSKCTKLKKVVFPDSLIIIGDGAFSIPSRYADHMELREISFGKSLERIGTWAFAHNEKLKEIHIPHVNIIEEDAFYYCLELKTVTIGDSIKEIAKDAFKSSRYSIDLYCYAKEPPCGNLDNVGCYYVLEENFNAWENSYKIDKEKIKIFSP